MTTAAPRYPIALRRFAVAAERYESARVAIAASAAATTYDPASLARLNRLAQRALRYSAAVRASAVACLTDARTVPANLATIARLRDAVRARADARTAAAYPH